MRPLPLLFATAVCVATAATAQGVPPMDMSGAMFNAQAMRGVLDAHLGTGTTRRLPPSGRSSLPLARATGVPAAATRYRRDPGVTRRVQDQFLAFIARSDPGELAAVRSTLARMDFQTAWSRATAPDGFRTGDAADSMAAYWLLNWVIANGRDNSGSQAEGVRSQVRAVLASTPNFASLTESQRQEMSEVLMLNFVFQQNGYLVYRKRGDVESAGQAAKAAAARFRDQLGVDPRTLALTDAGFARRG